MSQGEGGWKGHTVALTALLLRLYYPTHTLPPFTALGLSPLLSLSSSSSSFVFYFSTLSFIQPLLHPLPLLFLLFSLLSSPPHLYSLQSLFNILPFLLLSSTQTKPNQTTSTNHFLPSLLLTFYSPLSSLSLQLLRHSFVSRAFSLYGLFVSSDPLPIPPSPSLSIPSLNPHSLPLHLASSSSLSRHRARPLPLLLYPLSLSFHLSLSLPSYLLASSWTRPCSSCFTSTDTRARPSRPRLRNHLIARTPQHVPSRLLGIKSPLSSLPPLPHCPPPLFHLSIALSAARVLA